MQGHGEPALPPEGDRPRAGMIIAVVVTLTIIVGVIAVGAVGWAGWSIAQRLARSGADPIVRLVTAPLVPLPDAETYRSAISADYRGFEIEKLYWGPKATSATTSTLIVWMRSTETKGFRHIAMLVVDPRSGESSQSAPTAPWDYLFNSSDELYSELTRTAFERLWVDQHPELACGDVNMDDRVMDDLLSGYQAEAFSVTPAGGLEEAGTFWYRFDFDSGKWDTDAATGAPRPKPAITAAKAKTVVKRRFPGFRVAKVVSYPAIVGKEIGDRFVVLRHPDAPGLLLVRDPLQDTARDPYAIGGYLPFERAFFARMDVKRRAFARDWVRAHPGTVVSGIESQSNAGDSPDFLTVSYFPSIGAVATDEKVLEDAFVYNAKSRSWSSPN